MAFSFLLLLAAQATPPPSEPPIDWDKEFGVEQKVRDPATGETPVAPYTQSNANAGARPFSGKTMARTFGGQDGIRSITARLVELSENDHRTTAIFKAHDMVRLRRTLYEQFCYILNAGCDYSGRDMASTHKDLGLKMVDLNALVENLQRAMREAHVPFAAQNRLLAKLAPMDRDTLKPR
ncbi:group 1 truncated hemoglobin [Novosphingobium sp. PS1R-30]|uniref:Group 1 truncated hemoglobin n=1 Tax=Novosphingobium anseongense TaxID=3133436 RepID=A0ABU8S2J2_9SPHN